MKQRSGPFCAAQGGMLRLAFIVMLVSASCQKPKPQLESPTNSEQLGIHDSNSKELAATTSERGFGKERRANLTAVDTGVGVPERWVDEDLRRYLLDVSANYSAAPKTGEERAAILEDMVAVGTPDTLQLMRGLFERESDVESKLDILAAAQDVAKAIDAKLALFQSAVSEEQPFEVRRAGIEGLAGLQVPKVVPLLRRLQNDRDPKIQRLGRDAEVEIQRALASADLRDRG